MAKLNYNAANLRGLGTDHQLKPGENVVDDAVWAKWKDHPHVKTLVDEGTIEVLEEKSKGKPGPKPKAKDEKPAEKSAEDLKAEMDAAIEAAKAKEEAEAKAKAAAK